MKISYNNNIMYTLFFDKNIMYTLLLYDIFIFNSIKLVYNNNNNNNNKNNNNCTSPFKK